MALEMIAGRYRVERAVGHGGMGTVWLCHDEILHRPVAVKQIGTFPGESTDDARRAMREARTAAALNHRNAVSIYDVVDHEGSPWLVMEYVPSRTLAELMENGPLPPERVAKIGAQVAAALASAHRLGIIHRDVKPGNILVGEDDLAKISDFGIARIAHDEQLTQTGLMTGTPSYFSPELARGADAGPESDVWALGATLYAAVEGRPPYGTRTNPIATLQAIAYENVDLPRRAGFLLEPIGHLMDRNPASRWTMAQAETALRRLVERPGATEREQPTAVFAAPPNGRQEAPEAADSRPPTEAGSRRSRWVPALAALAALVVLALGGYWLASAGTLGDPTADDSPTSSAADSESPSESPTESPSESPSESPTESPSESPTESPSAEPDSDSDEADAAKVEAVESYFDTVPSDLDAGWSRLSPRMQQEVGRESYYGFWRTIESVDVANVRPVGDDEVRAEITYTKNDGSVETEQHRLTLARDGSTYLIDDDTLA